MTVKSFAGAAAPTTLSVGVDAVALILTGVAFVGWPSGAAGPFNVTLDKDTPNEEKVLATSISGTTLTLAQRGYDGTTAHAHGAGAAVEHGWFGVDAQSANTHENATGGVHGLGGGDGSFVGTTKAQTLTGKTMSGLANTFSDIPLTASPLTSAAIIAGDAAEAAARIAADGVLQTQRNDDITGQSIINTVESNARIAGDAALLATDNADKAAWTAYTPTFAGTATPVGAVGNFFWKVIGKTMYLRGAFTGGTATTGGFVLSVTFPAGKTAAAVGGQGATGMNQFAVLFGGSIAAGGTAIGFVGYSANLAGDRIFATVEIQ